MPLKVICDKCGAILYEGEVLKTPLEIVESYKGKCPNCSKKLSQLPINVEIKLVDKANQLDKRKRR